MRNVWTIAKREFNMYFVSPVAYAIAFVLLLVLGLFFIGGFWAAANFGGAPDPTATTGPFVIIMLFSVPAVTMRLMAEEQRSGTIELLLTAPVRDWELVLGKWLAAFAFVSLLILVTGLYPLILQQYTIPSLDWGSIRGMYGGLFLMVAAMLAVGVFASTLFANQIAAFFLSMGILVALWILGTALQSATGWWADFLNYLVFSRHYYNNFLSGAADLTDIVYFVSVVALFLFLATRIVESRRWR
jgi:ABC-2 type transport system permease protein